MIPARSVAASVVALGFAGTMTAPLPAFAVPATCDQPGHYAAQSGAELLRIDRLELGPKAGVTNRKGAAGEAASTDATSADAAPGAPGKPGAPRKNRPSGTAGARPDSGEVISGSASDKAADGTDSGSAGGGSASGTADDEGREGGGTGGPDGTGGTGGSGGEVPDLDQEYRATTLPVWEDSTGRLGGPSIDQSDPADRRRETVRHSAAVNHTNSDGHINGIGEQGRTAAGRGKAVGAEGRTLAEHGETVGEQARTAGERDQAAPARGRMLAGHGAAVGAQGRTAAGRGEAVSKQGGGAGDAAIEGVGLGDARSVLIADGPINSAGAARILNGQVAGSAERNDLVVQQAPPVNPKADERRTGSKRFGPVKVGDGSLSARAIWAHGTACGSAGGDTSTATAEISRLTITGGGSGSLVRVPEKISSRSGTALRLRGGTSQSVASATITAGRISLVDNEVRIRVLRAPELRATMTADGQGRVDYQPAVVEVSGKNGKRARLATPGDHIDITLSEGMRPLESLPASLEPISELPLPNVPGLPFIGEPETTPASPPAPSGRLSPARPTAPSHEPSPLHPAAPSHESSPAPTAGPSSASPPAPSRGSSPASSHEYAPGSTLRIALGDARQATSGKAIAARATAIRVTVVRNADKGQTRVADGPSGLVADLGIGMLAAAAVAPSGADSAHGASPAAAAGAGAGTGEGVTAGSASLPITGPRVVSLFATGASLVIGGICAVVLASRRRRTTREP
ncbi:hypothetical protein QLQ12_18340 [Actinoplanes sp. NEAU-A12]|uniref:Uncharacterized protein n=1 Tax=Actinoplanes sandaracinus TaxID=3045177 RepID=A0ABT6WLG5_9ACTN|nr:hypothetical protein [Actinoplanes sandaracinus]MDI6100572.1 hypothetical protein [Actinoplanes sandaracinus]